MSSELLGRAQTGFFGKLPCLGDFVVRGLPPRFRMVLDQWTTRNFEPFRDQNGSWPEAGFRGVIDWQDNAVALLIHPSRDRVGRVFPIVICHLTGTDEISQSDVDGWADIACPDVTAATKGDLNADELLAKLADISFEKSGGENIERPALWSKDEPPAKPHDALRQHFSSD